MEFIHNVFVTCTIWMWRALDCVCIMWKSWPLKGGLIYAIQRGSRWYSGSFHTQYMIYVDVSFASRPRHLIPFILLSALVEFSFEFYPWLSLTWLPYLKHCVQNIKSKCTATASHNGNMNNWKQPWVDLIQGLSGKTVACQEALSCDWQMSEQTLRACVYAAEQISNRRTPK